MARSNKVYQATPVPSSFTVSVTGHRKTGQNVSLQDRVGELLDKIATTCKTLDDDVNLRLNTALAAGADQSAAQALLAANKRTKEYQWQLQAILPFERRSYQKSLSVGLDDTATDIAESFSILLQHASTVYELADLEVVPPVTDPDIESTRQQYWQSQRYRTLGNILASQADVLLAIWDGKPAGGPGGTGDVVSLTLAQGKSVIRIDPVSLEVSFLRPSHLHTDPIRLARQPTWGPKQNLTELFDSEKILFQALARESICTPAWNSNKHKVLKPLSSAEAFFGTASIDSFKPESTTSIDQKITHLALRENGNSFPEKTSSTTHWTAYQYILKLMVALFERAKIRKITIAQTATNAYKKKTAVSQDKGLRVNYAEDDWSQPPFTPEDSGPQRSPDTQGFYQVDTPRPPQLNKADKRLRNPIVSTDAIATARAHAYRSSYVINFLGGAIAVWFGLAGLIWKPKFIFVGVELAALLALVVLYIFATRRSWHERWLNARFIAETLRAGRYLVWLGIGGRRALNKNPHWAAWYSNAVMASPPGPDGTLNKSGLRRIARELRSHVIHQINYHAGNASKLKRVHKGLELLGSYCLIAAIIVAAFYVLGSIFLGKDHSMLTANKYIVSVVCAGLPILASALMGIRFQGDFERFAERSEETEHQLREIDDRLHGLIVREVETSHQPLFEELSQIVIDLNETYERDLQDWYYVYSARPSTEPG